MSKLDETLAKILERAMELAEQSGEFVVDQAPDILREFYLWHTSMHILYLLLGILLIILSRYLPHLWITKNISDREDEDFNWDEGRFFSRWGDDGPVIAGWVVFVSLGSAGLIAATAHLFALVKILVSPKLYLIEYFL